MHDLARRPEKDRREVFRATAQAMRVHEAIVEKDFWVCWVLDYLFHASPWREHLVFKGGTSLSKAFGAIERFSEDIDLILDWRLLGYTDEEPWADRTAKKQDLFGKEANQKAAEFLRQQIVPAATTALSGMLEAPIKIEASGQDVFIHYPQSFSLAAIQPQIRLEIGPMAAWIPNEDRPIRSYAAERFPALFRQPETTVRTIVAERTFWEKATILHQEAHREDDKLLPPRYSRHYYDLYRLSRMPIREKALQKLDLLAEVVQFKMRFYRCPWAKYEEAKPGSLRLLPSQHHVAELAKDYRLMQAMLFGEIPSFAAIMEELADLEKAINQPKMPLV
jgi:hypothetical protein